MIRSILLLGVLVVLGMFAAGLVFNVLGGLLAGFAALYEAQAGADQAAWSEREAADPGAMTLGDMQAAFEATK